MYFNFKQIIPVFAALMLSFACTKVVDIPLPNEAPKIVISAYITEGDTIKALVSKSLPFLNTEATPVVDSNFLVTLYKNDVLLDTLQPKEIFIADNSNNKAYIFIAQKVATTNALYKIVAERNPLQTAFGIDAMPVKPELTKVTLDTDNKAVSFEIKNSGATDYYVFDCYVQSADNPFFITLTTNQPNILVDGGGGFLTLGSSTSTGIRFYLKHTGNMAKVFTFFYENPSVSTDNDSTFFRVSRVSENYYLHEVSKGTQDPIIPVFPEPAKLFTNVENGYGVVACASKTELKFLR